MNENVHVYPAGSLDSHHGNNKTLVVLSQFTLPTLCQGRWIQRLKTVAFTVMSDSDLGNLKCWKERTLYQLYVEGFTCIISISYIFSVILVMALFSSILLIRQTGFTAVK